MEENSQKVPFREKLGYSFGDGSANFVFQIMIMFQLGFYTDVFGIKASTAGLILLLARFFDALVDPMVGIISDRTNTRWGKYRPWILWTALPFCLFFWMAFTTPDLGERAKIIYAGVSYILLMSIYSFNNTPYSALGGVMSSDIKERTSISSVRFVFAMIVTLVVQGLTLPLVAKLGQGNNQKGWSMTILVYAFMALAFFIIAFLSTKERIVPPLGQKTSVKQDLKDVVGTKPWRSMFFVTLFIFTTLSLWGGGIYYYFNYYMDHSAIYNFLKTLGLTNVAGRAHGFGYSILDSFGLIIKDDGSNAFNVGFSFFNIAGQVVTIIGVLTLSQPLANRFGKKSVFLVGLSLTTLFTALFFVIPPQNIGWAFVLNMLKSAAYAPTIPLLWAMMGDVADYSEWQHQRRATGFVFAGVVFSLKAGLGLGGAICGCVVSMFGYVPNTIQSGSALLGIRLTSSLIPALTFFIAVVALSTYSITKSVNEKVQSDLIERRRNKNSADKILANELQ
jgi:glycoside/pentoside/hexuronide:cation symporter, GPH family